jgi:hypothetical protein
MNRAQAAKHKQQGLCTKCRYPAIAGKTLCETHLLYMQRVNRARTKAKQTAWLSALAIKFCRAYEYDDWLDDILIDFGHEVLEAKYDYHAKKLVGTNHSYRR